MRIIPSRRNIAADGGQFLFADGTVALPGQAWTSDPDTGFHWTLSGEQRWSSNGTLKLKFTNAGIITATGAALLSEVSTNINPTLAPDKGDLTSGLGGLIGVPAIIASSIPVAVFGTTVTLTAVNLKALVGTPITLIAAQGANTIIEFVSAIFMLKFGSEVLAESADNLVIEYTGGTDISGAIEMTGFIDSGADISMFVANTHATDQILTGVINEGIQLLNTDGDFTGNSSNDATMDVKITYRVHATGF